MKHGYSTVELLVSLLVLTAGAMVLLLSISAAVSYFASSKDRMSDTMQYFGEVTSGFSGHLPDGVTSFQDLDTVADVLGYSLSGPYAFFDYVRAATDSSNRYVFYLQDLRF